MAHLQPSTWRMLGLYVAGSYTALGIMDCLIPHRAAEEFFGVGRSTADSRTVSLFLRLLGTRDLSMAAALFAFAHQEKNAEMGTVIIAGTILCAADVVAIWRAKGWRLGATVAAGAVVCTAIGFGLIWS